MKTLTRFVAALTCISVATLTFPADSLARPSHSTLRYSPYKRTVRTFTFADGRYLKVNRNGFGTLYDTHHKVVQTRWIPASAIPEGTPGSIAYREQLAILERMLQKPFSREQYALDHITVVFKDGIAPSRDTITVHPATLQKLRGAKPGNLMMAAPPYTNDSRINAVFASLGVSQTQRLFASFQRSQLSSLHSMAQARIGHPMLNIANAYRVSLTNAPVLKAVSLLRAQPGIAYVSPDWTVTTMNPIPRAVPDAVRSEIRASNAASMRSAMRARSASGVQMSAAAAVPSNFSVASSLQSMLNSSNLDVIAAYQEIQQQFHQLPGTGETITNVSVGDVFSAEDAKGTTAPGNICPAVLQGYGATTHTIGGQRYLDWPGLPLIPAYAADANGHTDPSYVACGESPLDEVGLDFSMMAPLPAEAQRAGEQSGQVLGDLLGIAPGANYRLFVPATNGGNSGNFLSQIDGVFLSAASMVPKTDVISASLGEGFDNVGFPGRYLEDDPLTESVISTIVNADNIVVCISANDGLRTFTPASFGPSGGSTATNLTSDSTQTTNLNDMPLSTAPSVDLDSGAIDVGGTTLNDIFSRPISDPQNASFISQLAFPETRYNGGQDLSSGFGARVNISAPADNVVALSKTGLAYDAVDVFNEGGTSASAPEVAAAAAVAMQVARLTGHPFNSALDVRRFLISTATPVAQTPQTDQVLNVGPQLNVRRAVEQLLANGGVHVNPSVSRVAVFQRKSIVPLAGHGSVYFTNTDPTAINLAGIDYGVGDGPDGSGNTDPITIAPDWSGVPDNSTYSLYITGHPDTVLATTRFARLMPETILTAAGLTLASPTMRTVHLTYRASSGSHALAQTSFDLTFGPSDGTSVEALPVSAPPVVTGQSFQVSYDIRKVRMMNANPMLVVTEPGRVASSSPFVLHLIYAQPLSNRKGTVTIPVSALQGAGLYGVGVLSTDPASGMQNISDFATVRIEQVSAARPAAPVVQVAGSNLPYAHLLEFGFTDTLNVKWDVTGVPKANGAILEVSAPGPGLAAFFNMFNNPNGSIPDNDGVNTGSVKTISLAGISGTHAFKVSDLGLNPGMLAQIRVIPVNGQSAAGEASDVSTLITDGIRGAMGGWMDWSHGFYGGGFAINPNGNDAFLAEMIPEPGGAFLTAIDVFDQTTGATQLSVGGQAYGPFGLLGGGYYSNSVALFAENNYPQDRLHATYNTISTTQDGLQYAPQLSMPGLNDEILQTSYNPEAAKAAYLYVDGMQPWMSTVARLRTYDFKTGKFSAALSTPLGVGFQNGIYLFNTDMSLGKAIIGREAAVDFTGFTPSYFDVMDLKTGAVQEYASQASGMISGMAVDPTTHMAMTGSAADDAVVIFNEQTGTQRKVTLPYATDATNMGLIGGFTPFCADLIAADPVNHLFFIYAFMGPGIANVDYNATSPIYVYDENGNLQKTITGWAWVSDGDVLDSSRAYLQLNGKTRTAYLMMGTQIGIIKY